MQRLYDDDYSMNMAMHDNQFVQYDIRSDNYSFHPLFRDDAAGSTEIIILLPNIHFKISLRSFACKVCNLSPYTCVFRIRNVQQYLLFADVRNSRHISIPRSQSHVMNTHLFPTKLFIILVSSFF
jgi:hypothetical protein